MGDPIRAAASMIRAAQRHADDGAAERSRALGYYRGEMADTPAQKGRSRATTRDVRSAVRRVLPSLLRTILGGGNVVEYLPVGQGDEAAAEQATEYVNNVLFGEIGGRRVIEDAIHDALLHGNGILRWWWQDKRVVTVSTHTGLTDDALAVLAGDPDVEVLAHTASEADGIVQHDVRIRRTTRDRRPVAAVVPRERFLIDPDAVRLEDATLVGERMRVTRSDLVAMGHDRDAVYALSVGEDAAGDDRRGHGGEAAPDPANEIVDYWDVFVRLDADGDGIAELRRLCFAGGLSEHHLLLNEDADDVQFADVRVMAQPHRWEGISVFDDVADVQQIKTVLLRATLDNLYWQNAAQPVLQDGAVVNPEALFNPEFGRPVVLRPGAVIGQAVDFMRVPFIARESFAMLSYLDSEAERRTGITEASGGLAPDALQNMTATAAALIEQAGVGQIEQMVATAADGLKRFFRGILRLIVRHQDAPRTVRLRGKWVEFDPRPWNAAMDCSVNVGLGAGTRERDMAMMQAVLAIQERLRAAFGVPNPFVSPDNLWNVLSRVVQASGLKSPELYFTRPDPAALEQQGNELSPEQLKAQREAEVAAAKLQLERAKSDAELQLARERQQAEMQLARERMAAEMQLARERALLAAGNGPGLSPVRMGGNLG